MQHCPPQERSHCLCLYSTSETWALAAFCQKNRFLLILSCTADCSLDLLTISLQAGWAVTPASGPTGQSECYRAGSRWPSWCHTDSQIGFNCYGWSLAQWVCGGWATPKNRSRRWKLWSYTLERPCTVHTWTLRLTVIKLALEVCMWRQRRCRDYQRPSSASLFAGLTHFLHNHAACTHTHTYTTGAHLT